MWNQTVIDEIGNIANPSLAVDSNARTHIVYGDSESHLLKYAFKDSTETVWQTEIIEQYPGNFPYSAIAIDTDNKVHLCLTTGESVIRHLKRTDGGWETDEIRLEHPHRDCAIAVDSIGGVHIVFVKKNNGSYWLQYIAKSADSWSDPVSIDSADQSMRDVQIALSQANDQVNLHVGYYCWNEQAGPGIWYAQRANGQWLSEEVGGAGTEGGQTDIAVNSQATTAYISYWASSSTAFVYARRTTTGWQNEIIKRFPEDTTTSSTTSIAVDSNGLVQVVFTDPDTNELTHAYRDLLGWAFDTIDTRINDNKPGNLSSMAIDLSNLVHVAYVYLLFDTEKFNWRGTLRHSYAGPFRGRTWWYRWFPALLILGVIWLIIELFT